MTEQPTFKARVPPYKFVFSLFFAFPLETSLIFLFFLQHYDAVLHHRPARSISSPLLLRRTRQRWSPTLVAHLQPPYARLRDHRTYRPQRYGEGLFDPEEEDFGRDDRSGTSLRHSHQLPRCRRSRFVFFFFLSFFAPFLRWD